VDARRVDAHHLVAGAQRVHDLGDGAAERDDAAGVGGRLGVRPQRHEQSGDQTKQALRHGICGFRCK
jgi:hypothetical protein